MLWSLARHVPRARHRRLAPPLVAPPGPRASAGGGAPLPLPDGAALGPETPGPNPLCRHPGQGPQPGHAPSRRPVLLLCALGPRAPASLGLESPPAAPQPLRFPSQDRSFRLLPLRQELGLIPTTSTSGTGTPRPHVRAARSGWWARAPTAPHAAWGPRATTGSTSLVQLFACRPPSHLRPNQTSEACVPWVILGKAVGQPL